MGCLFGMGSYGGSVSTGMSGRRGIGGWIEDVWRGGLWFFLFDFRLLGVGAWVGGECVLEMVAFSGVVLHSDRLGVVIFLDTMRICSGE